MRHWKKQVQLFLLNLDLLRKKYDPKAVHDLRVAVKKLRAYLKLIGMLYPESTYRQEFEGTEQLFSILGKHRDLEVGISLLESFEQDSQESYPLLANHFRQVFEQATGWMQLAVSQYNEKEIKELTIQLQDLLKNADHGQVLDKINAIMEKERSKANKHSARLEKDTHEVRKIYKDILYQASLYPPGVLPGGFDLKRIKKGLDHLGAWQDHEMLYRKARHYRKDFVPSAKDENAQLKELEKNILEKKQKLLQKAKAVFEVEKAE